jgi:exodeoxyribonuclease VII large subunit
MSSESRDIYSISRLNSELRHVLEGSFPLLWVEGEISNLATPRSGHLYFSLKDSQAQIRCALFRNRRTLLRFVPENGNRVLARARVALYEPRGDCQLIIEHLEPAGDGALQQAFEQLKGKLAAEGLFDSERKHPLPPYPTRIGVISSPSGAAVRDVLQVLGRRFPSATVTLYPSSVQGDAAPGELLAALQLAEARGQEDVLILTRGGGSLEDLAAFNDETLARAIAAARIPLVSAVGHEIDFTIADFVSDRRAPTPSAAAELVSPDSAELLARFTQLESRIRRQLTIQMRQAAYRLAQASARLQARHPGARLAQQQQRLDELQMRMARHMNARIQQAQLAVSRTNSRLLAQHPQTRLREFRQRVQQVSERLAGTLRRNLRARQEQLASRARELNAVSPLATLERGYSITTLSDGSVVTAAADVAIDARLSIRLAAGRLDARVTGRSE